MRLLARGLLATMVLSSTLVLHAPRAHAAVFSPTTAGELAAMVNVANNNDQDDVIDLGGRTFPLTSSVTIQPDAGHSLTIRNGTLDGQGFIGVLEIEPGGSATLSGVAVTGGSTILGAGIYNSGVVNVIDSTVSGNLALDLGGGVFNDGTLNLTASTVSKNTAGERGGGIFNETGSLDVTSSTVTENEAGVGAGGISIDAGTVSVTSSIIADQAAGSDCNGSVVSNDFNLDSDNTCDFIAANDRPASDANLRPLQDNGGPTPTHALLTGSQAIDAGSSCGAEDQRGVPRLLGGLCDIGSYELARICGTVLVNVVGTNGIDRLEGTNGPDGVLARGGDDTIRTYRGDDCIFGGDGADTIFAGVGDDRIFGEDGPDMVFGQPGSDRIDGGRDNDLLRGGLDDDVIFGGLEDDLIVGQGGNDRLYGGFGDDRVHGKSGNDDIFGLEGRDTLTGGFGFDELYGGKADDRLFDQSGGELTGGPGHDVCIRRGSGITVYSSCERRS